MQCGGVQPISALSHTRVFHPQISHRHRTSSSPPTLILPVNEWETERLSTARASPLELWLRWSYEDMQLEEESTASSHTASTSPTSSFSYAVSTSEAAPTSHTASTSHKFSCAICMDEQPVDNIVELDCNHPICRDCVRGHICSKIEEHRFPVLCPVCMMEKNDQPGVISESLVQIIGVDERQYAIWQDMELNQHSVLIHCRGCQRSVLVDKEEHEISEVLMCPLPDCMHVWCKACQQPITSDESPHSCDGTTELEDLMKQQGWKYCPNCKTPVERNGGCRHMNCIAPSCNTHFCYACGECIIRSAVKAEIQGAVATHYSGSTCQMFDETSDDKE